MKYFLLPEILFQNSQGFSRTVFLRLNIQYISFQGSRQRRGRLSRRPGAVQVDPPRHPTQCWPSHRQHRWRFQDGARGSSCDRWAFVVDAHGRGEEGAPHVPLIFSKQFGHKNVIKHKNRDPPRFSHNPKYTPQRICQKLLSILYLEF